jgi:hypothetical protein
MGRLRRRSGGRFRHPIFDARPSNGWAEKGR